MAPAGAPPRLVVATRNDHKLRELAEILTEAELVALPNEIELPPETASTFTGNALIKARATHGATGEPTIADDSGIAVTALGGRPGVHSARFAGPAATDQQNLDLLLSLLARHDDRSAAYVCVIAHIGADGAEALFEGRCEGTLISEPRGSGGFGYDPAFVPTDTGPDDQRTMAELEPDAKHAISHRGRAARALAEALWPARGAGGRE
jgi:XTP/dITP diphosphohydrolase